MGWAAGTKAFDRQILVPFPWGSELSGLDDEADIGWYKRTVKVDPSWEGRRIFLTIGASDWETEVWIDGTSVGTHRGGYVPFSFELTDHVTPGSDHVMVIRVDDARRDFTLYGKQGYGNARGIWQTPYLEARGESYLDALHFSPDIDSARVRVMAYFGEETLEDTDLELRIQTPGDPVIHQVLVPRGERKMRFEVSIPDSRLWDLDDPYLYEVEARFGEDRLSTYFGMRKISVADLPGTGYPYIALNGKPVYLQLALDQSYHPEGFYTFPSDQFMKDEILRSKSIGLNGIRTHIKVEVPRKLYWADKLGLLVMEDLPNSWGEPDIRMQKESEYTLRKMIRRDYNHPSIFSWVIFNETWGLITEGDYLPETQAWVASMYYLAKSLDQTRLVEDNSICCGRGHTETDINSWHAYLPGWKWDDMLTTITENNYPGSTFHFEDGYTQGNQPNINSECGNVWGYEGSTGDVDWSWDYHRMLNSFRRFPEVAGWLYTEHHDVINEWNGYWRFDRTEKQTGFGEIFEGMSLNDLHAPVYLSPGNEICSTTRVGSKVEVPLFLSAMTGTDYGPELQIIYLLELMNRQGDKTLVLEGQRTVAFQPWMQEELEPLDLVMPGAPGLACLKLQVENAVGEVLMRNFMHFEVQGGEFAPADDLITFAPASYEATEWDKGPWEVLEGRKVNGTGRGYFRYHIPLPADLNPRKLKDPRILVELSAKELFDKDRAAYDSNQDFMKGSRVSPSANPNAYPMTDETLFPSEVALLVEGREALRTVLPDDPADHRGVLSWHHQLKDRKLREAGSYGYLTEIPVSRDDLEKALEKGYLEFEIRSLGEGGVAVYGKEFGRYPLDPTLVLE